jgi:2-keto-4-pentenoate hydratase
MSISLSGITPRVARRDSFFDHRLVNGVSGTRLPTDLSTRGRSVYGETAPSAAHACARTSPLTDIEVLEVATSIANGRREHRAVRLSETLQTRDWGSVEKVIVELDRQSGRRGSGWKVGAASNEIREAEGLPSPSPGRIYEGTVFQSGAILGPELFINYRNIEAEFAFELGRDFLSREEDYDEDEVRGGIRSLFPALELGDSVFLDWYGSSGYFGTCLDNGGSAAFVMGEKVEEWTALDLAESGMDLFFNDTYLKSGKGNAAMGHPVTSLTWMINWARRHSFDVLAGEVVSTGTCTGHCFALPGDTVRADFGSLGQVEVTFA